MTAKIKLLAKTTRPECGGRLRLERQSVELFDKPTGEFESGACAKCGAVFLSEEEMNKVEGESKKLGLFGMEALTKVGASGNSVNGENS